MLKSSPEANPKPPFGPNLDSTALKSCWVEVLQSREHGTESNVTGSVLSTHLKVKLAKGSPKLGTVP